MGGAGFFWALLDGVSPELWRRSFYGLAKHLPGLGGVHAYDELDPEDVLAMHEQLTADHRRERKAIAAAKAKGKRNR